MQDLISIYKKLSSVIIMFISFAFLVLLIMLSVSAIVMYLALGQININNVFMLIIPWVHIFLSTLRFISYIYLIHKQIVKMNIFLTSLKLYIDNSNKLKINLYRSNKGEKLDRTLHRALKNICDFCDLFEMSGEISEMMVVVNWLSVLVMTMFSMFYIIYNPINFMEILRYASFIATMACMIFMHILNLYLIKTAANFAVQVSNN